MKEMLSGLAVIAYVISVIGGFVAVNGSVASPSILVFIAGSILHSMISMVVLYIDALEKAKFEKEMFEKIEQQIQKEKINALNPNK